MKNYLEARKDERGFTLMEMLIVVAIIAVLVAIAIPIFNNQLEKSREATDIANVRSAYAAVVTQYLNNGSANPVKVKAEQKQTGWQTYGGGAKTNLKAFNESGTKDIEVEAKTSGDYTVSIDSAGVVTVS